MAAQIKLRREECAKSMVQRGSDAAVKGALIKSSTEECALSTEQG